MTTTLNKPFGSVTQRASKRRNNTEFEYLKTQDRRMRFNNSKDPIYYIFDCIDSRPVSAIAKEFVKDSFYETVTFISKIVG